MKLYLEQIKNPRAPNEADMANSHVWRVTKVVDATEPRIGTILTRSEVHYFCGREDWTVEIK